MRRKENAFTIVELLIVIVVIGILAAITIVAYNGVQKRAQNTARVQELMQWNKTFEVYRAEHGEYPDVENRGYCLGSDFPNGYAGVAACRDFNAPGTTRYDVPNNVALMDALKSVGTLPQGARVPVADMIGPYASYTSDKITLSAVIAGKSYDDCPEQTKGAWTNNATKVVCSITLNR